MSTIGFYRYKISTIPSSGTSVKFYVGGVLKKTCTFRPIELCTGKIILKYLNKDGQYRFYPFTKYYEEIEIPTAIGSLENIVVSIQNSQAKTKNIGYKSERILNVRSELISTEDLEILKDIYSSPRVYLFLKYTGIDLNDWVQVIVKANKSIRKEAKANFTIMELEITLPPSYNIKMQ